MERSHEGPSLPDGGPVWIWELAPTKLDDDCRIMKGALMFGRRQELQSQNDATLKGGVFAAAVPNE